MKLKNGLKQEAENPVKKKVWEKRPMKGLFALIFRDIPVRIHLSLFPGTTGIKFLSGKNYLFFTRIKPVTEKKAGSSN